MSRREGCKAVPAELFSYLGTLSRTGALEVYLHLLDRAGGTGVWLNDVSQRSVADAIGKSRNTVRIAFHTLTELAMMRESAGNYLLTDAVCGGCTITCGKVKDDGGSVSEQGQFESHLPVTASHETPQLEGVGGSVPEQGDDNETTDSISCTSSTSKRTKNRGDSRVGAIFDHWCSHDALVSHRFLIEKQEKAIAKRLAEFDSRSGDKDAVLAEVCAAIDNYATCLAGAEYRWSYAWTLQDFMTRGLERFLDEAKPLERERQMQEQGERPHVDFDANHGAAAFEGL